MKSINRKFKQAGATLMEALSFLAISAIVVIGATSLLSSAFGASDANQHLREIIALRTGIKSYLAGQGSYVGATNQNLITAGIIPSTLSVSGTSITNGFGGAVTITGTATNYTITSAGLSAAACAKVVPQLTGFTSIQIGPGGSGGTAKTVIPYPAGTAVTDCGAGTDLLTLIGN